MCLDYFNTGKLKRCAFIADHNILQATMCAKASPTILLLPGAFTTPACFDYLAPHLEKAGYPVVKASLIGTNPSKPQLCTAEGEGHNLLNNHLLPLIDQGKDVLIFAHSFGATACSGANGGLTRSAREGRGLKGGVIGIVYISFAFCQDGQSQLAYLGGVWPPFCKLDTPAPGLLVFEDPKDRLYNDIDDAGLRERLAEGHLPQATAVFETPVKEPLWTDPELAGRRVYVKTVKDATFPSQGQDAFVQGCGVEWVVKEVEGGHCAFISRPEEVARIIIDAAEQWREKI